MGRSSKAKRINNEVLDRLWNDPDVRELTNSMKTILPERELMIDYKHLIEGGYIGDPRYFHIRIGQYIPF